MYSEHPRAWAARTTAICVFADRAGAGAHRPPRSGIGSAHPAMASTMYYTHMRHVCRRVCAHVAPRTAVCTPFGYASLQFPTNLLLRREAVTPRTSITPRSARSSNDKSPGRRKTQGLAAPLTRGSRLAPRIIFCSTEPRSIFGLCPRPRSRDREPPRARTAHPYLNKIDSWSSRRS